MEIRFTPSPSLFVFSTLCPSKSHALCDFREGLHWHATLGKVYIGMVRESRWQPLLPVPYHDYYHDTSTRGKVRQSRWRSLLLVTYHDANTRNLPSQLAGGLTNAVSDVRNPQWLKTIDILHLQGLLDTTNLLRPIQCACTSPMFVQL